jgi:hypothetical protein
MNLRTSSCRTAWPGFPAGACPPARCFYPDQGRRGCLAIHTASMFANSFPRMALRTPLSVPAPACKEISSRPVAGCGGSAVSLQVWTVLCSRGVTPSTKGKRACPGRFGRVRGGRPFACGVAATDCAGERPAATNAAPATGWWVGWRAEWHAGALRRCQLVPGNATARVGTLARWHFGPLVLSD